MHLNGVHTIVFDFDGVFTDNKVYVSESGYEMVRCDRGDGLAISNLKKYFKEKCLNIDLLILSTEVNHVVTARAKKMRIKCHQGCNDKHLWLSEYLLSRGHCVLDGFKGVVYLGNDINDLTCMLACEYSFAPIDGHPRIRDISTKVCRSKGGEGFVREFIDNILIPSLELETKKIKQVEKSL